MPVPGWEDLNNISLSYLFEHTRSFYFVVHCRINSFDCRDHWTFKKTIAGTFIMHAFFSGCIVWPLIWKIKALVLNMMQEEISCFLMVRLIFRRRSRWRCLWVIIYQTRHLDGMDIMRDSQFIIRIIQEEYKFQINFLNTNLQVFIFNLISLLLWKLFVLSNLSTSK